MAVGVGTTGYTWTIPNAISDLVKIKVQDAALGFEAVNAMSSKFTIRGGITFDAPDNGENRAADTAMDIAWTYTGSMVNFDIYYSIVPGAGTFPDDYVQIADNVAAATACSGGSCSYTWPADETSNTDAVLNTASILVNNNTATSSLLYVAAEGTEFKRGASVSNLTVFNGPFIPVGSTTSEIQWTKLKGLVTTTQMKVEYTNNAQGGPPTWNELIAGTDNDGSFIWPTVPGTLNDLNADVKLRITQVNPDNSAVTLISTETFCIRAAINVTAPTGSGSESWGLLEAHDIKFTKQGALQTVNIYYAPDGTNYEAAPINTAGPIDVSALADNAEYTWTWNSIPANTPLSTAGFNSRIKVKAETPTPQKTNNAQGISGGGFQIRGSVNSVTPSGDLTNIRVGDQTDIGWVPTGAILKYKVEYSHVMTGGPTWVEITPAGGVDGDDAGGGAKKWTWNPVLDTISNNVLFRVSDYNNSNANSVSPVASYIRGKLSIPSPIVTDIWTVGNTPTPSIQWDKTGSIGDLKIEYSTTGTFTAGDYSGGNVYTIENAYFSGSNGVSNYAWVAGIIGANRKISDTSRIRMTNLSAPAGTQLEALSALFKIRPNFTSLDNPTVSTLWYATDTDTGQTIEWVSKSGTKSGNVVPTCIVEYSTNGADYFTVPGGDAAACGQGGHSLLWTPMADLRNSTVRIKISYNDYTSINTDLLGAPAQFTVRPKVVVTPTPDASTSLLVGQTYPNLIKWTYSGSTTNRKVEVRYYPGDGLIATDVPAGNGATGVTWTNVPDVIGNTVTVKVIDMDFNASQGESPQFKIAGNVVLTAPVLNQKLVASSATNTISWNFWGSNRTVNVYYDPDDASDSWTLIGSKDQTGNGASGSSTLNWDLSVDPAVTLVGARYRIRLEVQDPDTGLRTASVSPLFKVIAAASVTSPVNGTVIYSEDPNTQVTWNKTAGTGLYKWHVYYTNNSEAAPPTWIRVTDVNGVGGALTAFDWNPIPRGYADLVSTDQRVRIVQFYETTPATDLDNFTADEVGAIAIGTGSQIKINSKLTVTYPTNNVSWDANTTERIKWTKTGDIHSVDVYYSPLGDFSENAGTGYKINTVAVNIADGCEPGCKDGSDYYFDWSIIGSTPLTAGYAGRIRVKAVDPGSQATVIGTQNPGRVEVKGSLTLGAPTGVGVALRYGGPVYKIQWTPYGAIQDVKLHYSTNGGEESGGTYPDPQNLIATVSATNGQNGCVPVPCYQWSIPDKIGNQVRVRVQDAGNDTVEAESSDNIEIYGSLALDWPNDTVTHVFVGQHYNVKWTPTGTYPGSYRQLVTFDFDKSGSGSFGAPDVLDTVPPTASNTAEGVQGTYDWLVPDEISGQVKFRVRVKDSPTEVAAMTGGTFKIVGQITQITSPASGVTWNAGDTNRQIVWSATGTVTNVHIEFYDGTGWRDVVADSGGHVNGANTYDWTSGIPADVKTNGVQIRITDVNYPETTFTTPYTFKILPILRMDAPTLDQQFTVQATYNNLIKWSQTQGTGVDEVNIYYAQDGVNWDPTPINGGVPVAVGVGTTGYTWTVPNSIGSLVKIKVQDAEAGYELVNAVSDKFTIRGGITFQVPQGGVNRTAETDMDISWQYTGSIVNFDIYYSIVAGAATFPDDYVLIADNVAAATYCGGGACNYTWPAGGTNDDMVLNTASILINNNELTSSMTYVSSEGTEFKRGALVSNLLPSNGQTITAGTDYEITWVKDKGPSSNTKMKLEYSNNYSGARTWNPALDSAGLPLNAVGNTGAAIWRVPKTYEDLQADLRLRITQADPDNADVQTLGAGTAFVIKAPITVVFPKGDQSDAERWGLADINREVIFKKTGAIKNVIVMYSALGDFSDEEDISGLVDISAQPDDTNIVWQWPMIPVDANLTAGFSGKMKVKADDPQQQRGISVGISTGGFQVSGSINNVTPTNATDLVVGGFKQIRWEPLGSFLKFKVEYSYVMSGPPSWIEITPAGGVDGIADGIGRTWTWGPSASPMIIPDTISNKVIFRISDYNNLNTYRDSNYVNPTHSNIIKGTLDLQTPDDSPQTFYIGDQIPISWTKLGTIGNLLIQHTAKGDSSDLVTLDPSFPPGNDGTNSLNPVWTTSTALKVSEDYRVKVSNVGAPAGTELSDISTATFGLRPKITGITSPLLSGLSVWYVGEQRTITFSATSSTKPDGSLPKVRFQYLVQGGSWTDVVYETGHVQAGQPVKFDCANGVNNFLWADGVADEFSEIVKIKIFFDEYPNDTNASMESATFAIRPQITLDPSINTDLRIIAFSNNNPIAFTYTGTYLTTVNVLYDLNNANTFAGTIHAGLSVSNNAGSTEWDDVPDVNGFVKIRVIDTANPNVKVDSGNFKIIGGLTLTKPVSPMTWMAKSTTNDIEWSFNGTIANVKIYYDLNEGLGVDGIAGSGDEWDTNTPLTTVAQTGPTGVMTYRWSPMPGKVTNKGVIKITDANNETDVYSVGGTQQKTLPLAAAQLFKIGAPFDITDPENGHTAYSEEEYTILWNNYLVTGVTKVALYYTNNSGDPSPTWNLITDNAQNTGTYVWNPVPRALADLNNTNQIRITQFDPLNEAGTAIESEGDFAILGALTVTNPSVGNESWGVNVPQRIKFTKKGDLQAADVWYSYDGAANHYVKITGTPVNIADGCEPGCKDGADYFYDWPLNPATTALTSGFTGRVKVKAVTPNTQTAVEGISSVFEVKGTVTLIAPTGHEVDPGTLAMEVGDVYTIRWQKFGAVDNVEIHFSTNGGLSYPDGDYPTGNRIYSGPSNINPQGADYTFPWDVPDRIGNDVMIRIRHRENTNVKNDPGLVKAFRIKGKLALTQPENAGISWAVGSTPKIQWTSTGTFTPVELHYSRNGTFGAGDVFVVKPDTIVTNCTPQVGQITCNGEANFEIEDQISAAAKVRIRGTGTQADVQYVSTNPFKIVGALDITAPESGQIWYVGETNKNITWDASGTITNVNIGYKTSFAGACNYTNIVSGDAGHASGSNTYVWPNIADERTETAYICIQDVAFPEIVNVSAAPFKIRPQITVTTPVSGTRVKVGSDNPDLIKFSVTGTKTQLVDIVYSENNGTDGYPHTIASDVVVTEGIAGVDWNDVADTITPTAKIKVVDKASTGEVVFGLSPDTFKIVGSVVLTAPPEAPPAEKIMLKKGQNYLIQWDKTGSFADVTIWYSIGGGAFNNQIKDQTPAVNKQFLWSNVPNTTSSNIVVRISDYTDPETVSFSAPIAIQSTLNITSPDNGEVWAVGESEDVVWTTDGTTLRVKLEYSTNGGGETGNWQDVIGAENILNGGVKAWTIPNSISNTVKVRVIDIADTDNWNESAETFKIRPNFRILSPNGNADPGLTDKLTVCPDPCTNKTPISWSVAGTVTTVKLQYSVDGGAYTDIPGAVSLDSSGYIDTPLVKSWDWAVPDSISDEVRVRVVYESDTTNYESSDYDFTIQGQLAFNPALPEAGDGTWYVGETKTITWAKTGTVPLIKLQYSKTSDTTGFIDIDTNLGGTTYPWVIPSDLSGTNPIDPSVWIRAVNMNADKPTIMAVSGPIDLRGQFMITSPIVTDQWEVDSSHAIQWTPYGTMGTIKLEYSTDDFVTPMPVTGPGGESAANLAAGVHEVPQSFTWKIPTNISNNVKIRISTNTVGQADVTASPVFKIVGGYKILTPNGAANQYFEVDGSTPITWERHGAIANAKLEYSTNGFSNEDEVFPIITVPGSDGSYSWDPVPNAIGKNVKIRISDPLYNGTTVFTSSDVSDAVFEIRGAIDIDFPVGGEIFLITDDQTVQWTKHGSMPAVKVEYDSDPADAFDFTDPATGDPNYIKNASGTSASSVAGTSFSWRIPDRKSLNKTRIKITNLSDPTNVFTVTPFFTVRGGFSWIDPVTTDQVFEVGSTGVLRWSTFGTIPNIDLQYSTNNDFSYNPMLVNNNPVTPATAVLNENTFNWIVPDTISKNVFLKIKDSTDPDAVTRTVKVRVAGKIYIDQPDSTQRWGVGDTKNITWHMDGSISNLKIEYSINDGATWIDPPISASIVGSVGTKSWLIPAFVTPTAKIRISDLITDSGATPAVTDAFKIVGSFSFTAPANGDTWYVTEGGIANPTRNIVWATQGLVPSVNLRYSKTGAAPWTLINTGGPIADGGSGGSYAWTVPDAISSSVKILIEDSADNETNLTSPAFSIAGDFQITAPAGAADKWGVNSIKNITWLKNGTDWSNDLVKKNMVYLFYSTDGTTGPWVPILNPLRGDYYVSNTGLFAWTIPDNLSPNSRIQIQNVDGPSVMRNSPANFKIMARFDVTAPDGGETVMAGPTTTITWNKWGTGVNNVRIDLALNGDDAEPTFDKLIAANTANDGSHPWAVSVDHVSPTAKIRISDLNDIDTANTSATSFIIRATFTMDPNIGSVPVEIGETYNIFWTKQGNIPNVKLTYSPDNFFSDTRMIEPTADGIVPNTDSCTSNPTMGCYSWVVPDIEDNKDVGVKLKVADPNDLDAEAISNVFSIIPKFRITFPNGNANSALTDKLKVGTPYTITWTSSSAQLKTPQVMLAYTTTGGAPYDKAITTTENDGSYNWVTANGGVPDDISNQVKIRVMDASDSVATDSSDFNLQIVSDFVVSAPNGGATYEVGDPFTIAWTNKGRVETVGLSYGTAGVDFASPVVIDNAYDNGSDFGNTYSWTIPNAIGTNVRVRVRSTTDEGFDISDTSFRVRGKLVSTLPSSTDKLPIGQSFTLQWTSYGTMPNVKLHYDTANGTGGFPNEISASTPNCTPSAPALTCVGSFVWNNIPDTPAAQARVRITDARSEESDVLGISDAFQIVGNLTVVTPNGGQDWRVNESRNIVWTWGGSIPVVKLYYTKEVGDPETVNWTEIDSGTVKDYSGDGLQQNGANNTIQRQYAWSVPDDISPTVRVKIADATNVGVYDVSNATFKIRGDFVVTSPNGNANIDLAERWVTSIFATGEGQNITWTANGTIPNVKLEYSSDDFGSDIHLIDASAPNCTPSGPGVPCTGSYYWEIPDAVLKDQGGKYVGPNLMKVRISDINDAEVTDVSDNSFKIDYYQVKWVIRDLGTYNLMSDLTVSEVKSTDPNLGIWQESGLAAAQPDPDGYTRIQPTPAGVWAATWSKTGYGDMLQLASLSKNNPLQDPPLALDPTYLLLMETTAVHIYISESRYTYDPVSDRLDVVVWLSRDGSLMTGTVNARMYIYKGVDLVTGGPIDLAKIGTDTGMFGATLTAVSDPNGAYKLQAGLTYVVKAQTQIASQVPNNVWYQTPNSFEITTPSKLQEVLDEVHRVLDKPMSEVAEELNQTLANQTQVIQETLAEQTETIQEEMANQTNLIQTAVNDFTESVQESLVALEEGAKASQEAGEQLKATAERFSWKTSSTPNPALAGDTVTIAAQGLPGLFPVLSIYNFANKVVVASGALVETKSNPGNYSFTFKADPGTFQAGKAYTFIVSEDTTGGLVAGSGFVESTSLTTIAGLVASAPGAEEAAKKALDIVKGIEAAMAKGGADVDGVKDQIYKLKTVIEDLPGKFVDLMKKDGTMGDVKNSVNAISTQLTTLAGDQGYDISQLMSQAISSAPSIKDLRKKSDAIRDGVDIVQKTIEAKLGGSEEPLVLVSYTSGSVVIRVIVANPSEKKTQEVPVKVYLPQETKPDDVMDKGDLDFGYDEKKAVYFVYKDKVLLAPKETRVFEVELKDIWFIPDETLNGLRTQTEKIMKRIEGTPYFDQAKLIADTIFGRLDRVATSQADESVNKELHIGLYRANLIVIDNVKADIAKLEKMLVAVGAPPAPELLAESKLNLKTPSRATTWFIIFAILVFIGLLGVVFFFTWQSQVKETHEFPEDKDGTKPSGSDGDSGQKPPNAK
ncbi:MAG: hypothetical protein V1882_07850 [Candidatus Omnitrophota bacterium]